MCNISSGRQHLLVTSSSQDRGKGRGSSSSSSSGDGEQFRRPAVRSTRHSTAQHRTAHTTTEHNTFKAHKTRETTHTIQHSRRVAAALSCSLFSSVLGEGRSIDSDSDRGTVGRVTWGHVSQPG